MMKNDDVKVEGIGKANADKPILFSGPMVRAILEGRKTQTRRVVNSDIATDLSEGDGEQACDADGDWHPVWKFCPYGRVGDRLWVKETFMQPPTGERMYRADKPGWKLPIGFAWKPSIFMPRVASRITLEIVSVRVERLQEISAADAISEGIEPTVYDDCTYWKNYEYHVKKSPVLAWHSPIQSYHSLWCSINGSDAWIKNPWVWVLNFKKLPEAGKS